MEIKIPKEVRQHKGTIFFGLSARQFFCAGERRFVSRNFHYELLKRKGGQDFD